MKKELVQLIRAYIYVFVHVIMCGWIFILFSLEVTGVIATDAWRFQLLDQNADHIDEDDEVHLHRNK